MQRRTTHICKQISKNGIWRLNTTKEICRVLRQRMWQQRPTKSDSAVVREGLLAMTLKLRWRMRWLETIQQRKPPFPSHLGWVSVVPNIKGPEEKNGEEILSLNFWVPPPFNCWLAEGSIKALHLWGSGSGLTPLPPLPRADFECILTTLSLSLISNYLNRKRRRK